jgi:hypothetical protein
MCTAVVLIVLAIGPGHPFAEGPSNLDTILPIRGLAITAPHPDRVDDFVDFIKSELAPNEVNTLVLRIDFNYAFRSHPELRDEDALNREDVRRILKTCRKLDR